MGVNLKFLETFVLVARYRSFSVAAETLHTTQAAISSRIATLEREMGVRLFDRDPRQVHLTAAGRAALPQAEQVIRLTHSMRIENGSDAAMRGCFSLGVVDSIVHTWLPALLCDIKRRYPRVDLDMIIDNSLGIARGIRDGQIDLGLIAGPMMGGDVENLYLGRLDCVWLASPALDIPSGPIGIEALAAHPFISFARDSQMHRGLLQQLREAGVTEARFYNSNSLPTNARMVSDGIGVSPMPRRVVAPMVRAGQLRALDVYPPCPPILFHAVHIDRPNAILSPMIARMAQEAAVFFEENGSTTDHMPLVAI